jgi:hypothetical protein
MQKIYIFILSLLICLVSTQDGLTRLEVRKQFNKKDFVFDFNKAKATKGGESSTIKQLTVSQLPALQGFLFLF